MALLIKRYPNRKLYDTSAKRYITLSVLADLIHRGEEIQVVDQATGEDMTAVTLTQIISGQEKRHGGLFPHPVLAGLVQAGMRQALSLPFGLLRSVDEEIRRRIEVLVSRRDLPEEEGARLLEKLLAVEPKPVTPSVEETVKGLLVERGIPSREELLRLMEQIDALLTKLDEKDPKNL